MPYQLRIYTINHGKLEAFTKAWQAGVYPLRQAHGFEIPGAWAIEETNQFIWYIGYEGEEEWDMKERTYYASAARQAMDPDPAQWIARAEHYFVKTIIPVS